MMTKRLRYKGFSLTEVLLAAGILTVGFLLIACVLPVGVKLTAMSTERTIAAVAAHEAFAKIELLGVPDVDMWNKPAGAGGMAVDPNVLAVDYANAWFDVGGVDITRFNGRNEAAYPSTDVSPDTKKYYWSAICRYEGFDLGLDCFQVTVFVNRHTGLNVQYPRWDYNMNNPLSPADYPRPSPIPVSVLGPYHLRITEPSVVDFVTDESTLVDARTGQIMRVVDRSRTNPAILRLEKKLFDTSFGATGRFVWVVPPAQGSGRYPCVGVYQRTVKFK